jgi:ABC-type multidrug transport system fused ATPase/permease subunit
LTLDASQAFRIGLARALVREPSLIVLAEPEGAIDAASAGEIDDALRKITESATLIILPRRVETIRAADRVYLFHDGKLHAEGTHTELIGQSELYRHVIYLRFNPFRDQVRM